MKYEEVTGASRIVESHTNTIPWPCIIEFTLNLIRRRYDNGM